MDKKITSFLIILTILVMSCKNQKDQNELHDSEKNDPIGNEQLEAKVDTLIIDKIKIVEQLQGKWRENQYPFRTAEFSNATVKFVEEGTEGTPKFEKFELGHNCPFDNNNIKALKSGSIILTLPESTRCEKLKVVDDTLILSGYSKNMDQDYNILYIKSKV